MQAALSLVAREANFSALSLRQVAREAGVVPTAFYRHFADMDALGLTLVEDTFAELRTLLRDADLPSLPLKGMTRYAVSLFAYHVRDRRLLFQFLVKERFAGTVPIRRAIDAEIDSLVIELARDFGHFDTFGSITDEDLQMIAGLVVNAIIALSERILDVDPDAAENAALMLRAEKQLRLIFLGVGRWQSQPDDDAAPGD
ncbi:TetR family transcriptional regulator [Salinisphaera sp. Q1T1-3]|uniref:TetR family transcriptional regulator n=1 Tax=Salinisphaera sp. Q1T1-3 TaxID=2321229 RepID=UPI001F345A4E|nr:TetR family transcriptional regulator [Salinisphaera sp. Q1T1-3]